MTDTQTTEEPTVEAILLSVRSTLRLLEAITQWHRCTVRYCDELAVPHPDALVALEAMVGREAAALDTLMRSWPGPISNWRPGDATPGKYAPPASGGAEPQREEPG